MVENVEISVIIPAYNIEAYIEKCVDSVLNQKFQKFEIIIIDDGSSDSTSIMCDKYQKKSDKIKVLHQRNRGVVSARKKGVKIANGEYIAFVDGDDWVESDMLEKMYHCMHKTRTDIVASGFFREYLNERTKVLNEIPEGIYEIHNNDFLEVAVFVSERNINGLNPSLWNKLFRKDILMQCIDDMDEGIHYAEDLVLLWQYLMRAKKIYILEDAFYHYVERQDSCMHSYDSIFFEQINKVHIQLKEVFVVNNLWDTLKKPLGKWFLKQIMFGLNGKFDLGFPCMIPEYYFENNVFDRNNQIILYGAGRVGRGYHLHIKNTKCVNLVAWVDKNFEKKEMRDLGVNSVEKICEFTFDYILIATLYYTMASEIKEQLLKMGISEKKIIWFQPKNYF